MSALENIGSYHKSRNDLNENKRFSEQFGNFARATKSKFTISRNADQNIENKVPNTFDRLKSVGKDVSTKIDSMTKITTTKLDKTRSIESVTIRDDFTDAEENDSYINTSKDLLQSFDMIKEAGREISEKFQIFTSSTKSSLTPSILFSPNKNELNTNNNSDDTFSFDDDEEETVQNDHGDSKSESGGEDGSLQLRNICLLEYESETSSRYEADSPNLLYDPEVLDYLDQPSRLAIGRFSEKAGAASSCGPIFPSPLEEPDADLIPSVSPSLQYVSDYSSSALRWMKLGPINIPRVLSSPLLSTPRPLLDDEDCCV